MHRVLAGVLGALLLAGPAGWGAAEAGLAPELTPEEALDEPVFWWDVTDGDIVSRSGGTAGARGAGELPPPGERGIGYSYAFTLEGDTAPEAWAAGWFEALYAGDVSVYTSDVCLVDERLMCLLAQGTPTGEAERVYSFTWDLRTGKRLRLSDLFYDGVNYIEYINGAAVRELMGTRDLDEYLYPITIEHLRRPFTGFPRDYPYFSIMPGPHGGRMLAMGVAEQNPLFSMAHTCGKLAVPLPDDLSPYGLPWAEVTMARVERPLPPDTGFFTRTFAGSPDGETPAPEVYIARVGLGQGADPGIERKVNAALAALADRAAAHPLRLLLGAYPPLEPWVDYDATDMRLRAMYYANIYDGEFIYDVGLLAAAEIDLTDGEVLDGSRLAAAGENPAYLLECGDWAQGYFEFDMPEFFTLEDGSMYLGAWHSDDEEDAAGRLVAAWLQPSGVEAYYEEIVREDGE